MKIKKYLLLAFSVSLFFYTRLSAQIGVNEERCLVTYSEDDQRFNNWIKSKKSSTTRRAENIYRVPVVVHVLHTGGAIGEGSNLSKERIDSQIRILNEDFRRKENTRGFNSHPDGADARIEFALAESSPTGEETDGVVRVDISDKEIPPISDLMIVSAYFSFWNPNEYLNIWLLDLENDFFSGTARFPFTDLPGLEDLKDGDYSVPGYDEFFGIPVEEIDGIFVNSRHFGESDNDMLNLGRTATHEVGHFLGLLHTWGKSPLEGCEQDDYCSDTPPTTKPTNGCPIDATSCDGQRLMVENYMDYTDDDCMNIFTKQQIVRMRTVLENSPRRKSLLTSPALQRPDVVVGVPADATEGIRVYPNAAGDRLFIEFEKSYISTETKITLFTVSGRRIFSEYIDKFQDNSISFDIPPTVEDILLLQVEGRDFLFNRKVIRQ